MTTEQLLARVTSKSDQADMGLIEKADELVRLSVQGCSLTERDELLSQACVAYCAARSQMLLAKMMHEQASGS